MTLSGGGLRRVPATGAVAREPVRSSGFVDDSNRRHVNAVVIWKAATGVTRRLG